MRQYSPPLGAVANPVLFCVVLMSPRAHDPDPPGRDRRPPAAVAPRAPRTPGPPRRPRGPPVSGFVFYDENAQRHRRPGRDRAPPERRRDRRAAPPRPRRRAAASRSRACRTARSRPRPGPTRCPPTSPPGRRSRSTVPADRRGRGAGRARPRLPRAAERLPGLRRQHHLGRGLDRRLGLLATYLQADLRAFWGKAAVANDGEPGTKSDKGESRLGSSLAHRASGVRADPLRHERLERRGVPRRFRRATRSTRCARWSQQARDAGALPDRGHDPAREPELRRPQRRPSATTG